MEAPVAYKVLQLPISKINIEILEKFDVLAIARY